MKKLLLASGMICSAILSTHAQISPSMLWNFNFMVDAMPHTTQSWSASGFNLYNVDVVYNTKGKPNSFTTSTPPPMSDQIDQYKCIGSVSGNSLIDITQEKEAGETTWIDWNRTTFTSDGTNDTMVLEEAYNTTSSTWENDQKIVLVYNGAELTELTGYYWQGSDWTVQQKNQFIYTAGKIDSAISYTYNQSTSTFENGGYRKYFYSTQLDSVLEYDLDSGVMELSSRIVVNSSVGGKTASFTIYNWDDNAWEAQLKITYGTGSPTGLLQLDNRVEMDMFPNPATTELTLNLTHAPKNATVTILDIQGRVVLTQPIESLQSQLDIASLRRGVYFVRVEANGLASTQKLIKN